MKKEILIKISKYFFSSRLLFLLFAFLAIKFIPLQKGYLGKQFDSAAPYLAWVWANFDGRHYLEIAKIGYQRTNFAFFPFYPSLIRLTHYFLPVSHLYLGIVISLVSLFLAMIVIQKIVRLDFKEELASRTLLFLAFFSISFYYQAIYPDALFLLLSTTSFYFARQKKWLFSGLFGCLTTLTRFSGLALIPALAVEWYLQNKKIVSWRFFKEAGTALFLTGFGLVLYLIYLQVFYGDFLLFQKSMIAWRQNELIFPVRVVYRYLKIFWLVDKRSLVYWVAVLEFISQFLYLGLAFYAWKRIRASYGLFMVTLLMMVSFTGTMAGTPRYLLHLFPGFIALALLFKNKQAIIAIIILFFILGFLFTGLFTRGYFLT